MCMYVVFCKIDHCIHIHWCIVIGLGHNDPWVVTHVTSTDMGQRSSTSQWPLVQVFRKKGQCIHILIWCIFKSNITMIAKVCDRESRRDTWFENRLVKQIDFWLTAADPCITFDPQNALNTRQGFFLPNLVAIDHF